MNDLKNFYDLKVKTLENIDNNIYITSNDIEMYLQNYYKLYKWYELVSDDNSISCQKQILKNIKDLIENHKEKIKKQLESESCNLIEVNNEYSDFIVFLFSLRNKYPEFKESIIIDDMV